jgi:flagellar basal-body rod protein FlgB
MVNRLLNTDTSELVHRSLDASALQHKLISNNLANVDTPGFKRSEVIFREKLKTALEQRLNTLEQLPAYKTNSKHLNFSDVLDMNSIQPEVITYNNTILRNDQNNVDIDVEMAKLAQNTVLYNTLAQITQMQFNQLKFAIGEGKR